MRLPNFFSLMLELLLAGGLVRSQVDRGTKYCRFPQFLQTSSSSWGDWMCKSDTLNTIHAIKFEGHQYRICTISSNTDIYRQRTVNSACGGGQSIRRCVQDYGNNMYGVLYRDNSTFQCVKFILRGSAVVQLAVDPAKDSRRNCSSESEIEANFTLDEYPWISVNHFRSSQVACPFIGGFNFNKVIYSTKYHQTSMLCNGVDPPIRAESDCVVNDGIRFNFRHHKCLRKPAMNAISVSQRLLCIASWKVDGDGFAILRNPNNDRHFYCLRVTFHKSKVAELVLFLDWTCYRRTDLSSPQLRHPFNTPYITFTQAVQRNLTFPCTDEQMRCTNAPKDCQGHQCMRTCDQCVTNTGLKCQFPVEAVGQWNAPGDSGNTSHLKINQSTVSHPVLGQLECVSFNNRQFTKARAILWGNYQNGCYPRFLCMHYESPATSVMRYRLGDILAWPLTLEDDEICDAKHFRSPPDIDSSLGFYKVKPWNVAVRSQGSMSAMPCVLPSHLPDHSGFVDHNGRRGCISLRSKSSPFTISMVYAKKEGSFHRSNRLESSHYAYSCVAALTYSSLMTLTKDREQNVLCWLVVNSDIIVVIKTSACNMQTARGILKRQEPYLRHFHFWLNLGEGERSLHETCDEFYSAQEEAWLKEFWQSQSPVKDGAARSPKPTPDGRLLCACSVFLCFILTFLSPLMECIHNVLSCL